MKQHGPGTATRQAEGQAFLRLVSVAGQPGDRRGGPHLSGDQLDELHRVLVRLGHE